MYEAIRRLARDDEVRPGMEVLSTQFWLSKEKDTIEALETELARIQGLIDSNTHGRVWPEIDPEAKVLADRQAFLLKELKLSQNKCAKWEARKDAALKAKAVFEGKK